jgi:hypothetical protein
VARLGRRYVRVATDAGASVQAAAMRPGNNSKPDPLLAARQQYELAQLAVKRERVEKAYASWQSLNERFAGLRGAIAGYRGKVVPYVLGALDLAGLVVVLDQLGVNVADLKTMVGM